MWSSSSSAASAAVNWERKRYRASVGAACPVAWASFTPSSPSLADSAVPVSTGLMPTTFLPASLSAVARAMEVQVLPTPVSVAVIRRYWVT